MPQTERSCADRVLVVDGTWPLGPKAQEPSLAVLVSQSLKRAPSVVLDPRRGGGPHFVDCFESFLRDLLRHLGERQFAIWIEVPAGVTESEVRIPASPRRDDPDAAIDGIRRARTVLKGTRLPVYVWLSARGTSPEMAAAPPFAGPAIEAIDQARLVRVAVLDYALDITAGRLVALDVVEVLRDCAAAQSAGGVIWNMERG